MQNKLFVGSLAPEITNSDLEELFAQFGTVTSAQVITDRDSGTSKGFGFVEMGTPEEAAKAIQELHGKEVGGRQLTVNIARPKESRPQGPRPSNGRPMRRY